MVLYINIYLFLYIIRVYFIKTSIYLFSIIYYYIDTSTCVCIEHYQKNTKINTVSYQVEQNLPHVVAIWVDILELVVNKVNIEKQLFAHNLLHISLYLILLVSVLHKNSVQKHFLVSSLLYRSTSFSLAHHTETLNVFILLYRHTSCSLAYYRKTYLVLAYYSEKLPYP